MKAETKIEGFRDVLIVTVAWKLAQKHGLLSWDDCKRRATIVVNHHADSFDDKTPVNTLNALAGQMIEQIMLGHSQEVH